MFRILLPLLLLLLMPLRVSAQGYEVRGTVCERSDTLSPLPLCTVELLQTKDSVRVGYVSTGRTGDFSLRPQRAGNYILRLSYVGYVTRFIPVSLTRSRPHARLGQLVLEVSRHELDEARVTALSRQLTIRADTFVYHADAFDLPSGSSLSALVKRLPGLEMGKDGKLTFQGKAVSSILIDGKPFFADNATALANMPADAVKDVKVYEKTNDLARFTGQIDEHKATVLDLKIKKEYFNAWNVNLDAAGGTDSRYLLKGFASTFSARRRLALYGSVNNISESQQVDENGNWSNQTTDAGLFTYRKAGGIYSYDNGKADTEAGSLRLNAGFSASHDNYTYDSRANSVNLLSDQSSQYAYGRSYRTTRQRALTGNASVTWLPDTLSFISLSASLNLGDTRDTGSSLTSTYDREQLGPDAYASLFHTPAALGGVNANEARSLSENRNKGYSVSASYVRRFAKKGRSLQINLSQNGSVARNDNYNLSDYHYFSSAAPQPELLNYQYIHPQTGSSDTQVYLNYSEPLTRWLYLDVGYQYIHSRNRNDQQVWQLDRDAAFGPDRPLGTVPALTPELLNMANSYEGTQFSDKHAGMLLLGAKWEKLQIGISGQGSLTRQRLHYERDGEVYKPARTLRELIPSVYMQWQAASTTWLYASYLLSHNFRGLVEALPIIDNADPMQVTVNNPDLRDALTHSMSLSFNHFDAKHGHNFGLFVFGNYTLNAVVPSLQTDAVTGKKTATLTNVDGVRSLSLSGYSSLSLDSARHWSLSVTPSLVYSVGRQYVGAAGDVRGLSTLSSYMPRMSVLLGYRREKWSVVGGGEWNVRLARYDHAGVQGETGHQYSFNLSPQVELPFGMKLYTTLELWGRMGYSDDLLNHSQWIWNVGAEQAFLKSRALSLRLEGVDILHQRTAEYANFSASTRNFSSVRSFPSFWMLHVIYRFNTKKRGNS